MKLLVLIIFSSLASAAEVTAQGWRGIVPLRATRADVERLLGEPKRACPCVPSAHGMCTCTYEIPEGLIFVDYAVSPCDGYPSGWNVAADTVLRLRIRWEEPRAFSESQIDVSQFAEAFDDTLTTYYASREKGVEYTVSSDKKLNSTTYFPTLKDAHLRCPCFPALDESTQRSIHYDQYEFRSIADALGRLDSFLIAVSESEEWRGYVILYRGKDASVKTSRQHRRAIANHIYRKRGLSPEQLVILDGGYHDYPFIELFRVSGELSIPEPRATWKPCKQRSDKRTAG